MVCEVAVKDIARKNRAKDKKRVVLNNMRIGIRFKEKSSFEGRECECGQPGPAINCSLRTVDFVPQALLVFRIVVEFGMHKTTLRLHPNLLHDMF